MTLRTDIETTLTGAGYTVIPWGKVPVGRAVIVRPGGILEGRIQIEIWLINQGQLADPDEGLEEFTVAIYRILRRHLMSISAGRGPEYNPTNKTPRETIIFQGEGLSIERLSG